MKDKIDRSLKKCDKCKHKIFTTNVPSQRNILMKRKDKSIKNEK